ncbi:MAG: PEGA domain-containing protein [Acidobacteriota bacterium]
MQPLERQPEADAEIFGRAVEGSLERLHDEVDALRLTLSQLRSAGAELAHQYASLGDACRQAETRGEVATDALRAIESRLGLLETTRHLTSTTGDRLAALSQLANEIGRVAADFQAHKQSLDRGLAEASRITELLELFDARARTVNDHALCETVEHLEQWVTQAMAAFDRRLGTFEEQQHLIEQAVVEATHATAVISSLDARMAALMGQVMERTGTAAVGPLVEQRAATVGAPGSAPGRAVLTPDDKHALAPLPTQLQTLTVSARLDRDKPRSGQERSDIPRSSTVPGSATMPERLASVTRWWRAKKPAPILRWAAGFAALAVIGQLGTAAIRARHRPVETVGAAQGVHSDSGRLASPSESPSKGSGSEPVASPPRNLRDSRPTEPTGTSDSRSMTDSGLAPAIVGVHAGRSGLPTPRPTITLPVTGTTTNATPSFRGTLLIESVPSRATVFINQQRIGETPLQMERLPAGSQVVWLERTGFERWSTSVLVAADQQTRLSAKLQPLRGR